MAEVMALFLINFFFAIKYYIRTSRYHCDVMADADEFKKALHQDRQFNPGLMGG
jgi:hypothetical protein